MGRSYDDSLFDAVERHLGEVGPSGEWTVSLELPVPHVGDDKWEGWREYAVRVTFSEGAIVEAEVVAELVPFKASAAGPWRHREVPCGRGPIRLSAEDAERIECDYAMREDES